MSDLSSSPDTILQEPKSVVESVATTKKNGYAVSPGAYVTLSPDQMFSVISSG